jgi:hypothetical protein
MREYILYYLLFLDLPENFWYSIMVNPIDTIIINPGIIHPKIGWPIPSGINIIIMATIYSSFCDVYDMNTTGRVRSKKEAR